MTGHGTSDGDVTFWRRRQVEVSGGGDTLIFPESTRHPWVLVKVSCLLELRTIFNTDHVPTGAAHLLGLDCSAVKGLRVRVIKDLNCHVDSKRGTGCAEALINLPLTYGQTSFSRKLFLQNIECCALMETEIKARWKWGEEMEIQSTWWGGPFSKFFLR